MKRFISLVFCLLLFVSCANQARAQASSGEGALSGWVNNGWGFFESAPPDFNMQYTIDIYEADDAYYADIAIDGFQTMERLKAAVQGDSDSVSFIFDEYLPGNQSEPYAKGDLLLTLRAEGSQIYTDWGKLEPALVENQVSGKVYFVRLCFKEPSADALP